MSLLRKKNFVKRNKKEYEYYAICGQVKYTNFKANKMVEEENYEEILRIEYTPNTKNLLHRLKEQNFERFTIDFSSNKFNTYGF